MNDIQKQIDYWRNGTMEDWEVAKQLVGSEKLRHGLFFTHLTLEKELKSLVCRETNEIPPKIHNLLSLARIAKLSLSDQQRRLLTRFNRFQLEGRYAQPILMPTQREAEAYMDQMAEVYGWLKSQ